jgi:hypothetical protein
VHLELTGVPAHAFSKAVATAVLGSAAWVERLGAASASGEDLGRLQVVVWTDDLAHLPRAKELLVEEPGDLLEDDDGLILPGDARTPHCLAEAGVVGGMTPGRVKRYKEDKIRD